MNLSAADTTSKEDIMEASQKDIPMSEKEILVTEEQVS
jgi:hypothetical protein